MAVNSYRFISMYILIGIIMGMVATINTSQGDNLKGYDLKSVDRASEVAGQKDTNIEKSGELVQANQFSLQTGWGDQMGFGSSVGAFLKNSFLPINEIDMISAGELQGLEKGAVYTLLLLRIIITGFAGIELYFIIRGKVT